MTLATEATEHMRFREAVEDRISTHRRGMRTTRRHCRRRALTPGIAFAAALKRSCACAGNPCPATAREVDKLSSSVDTRFAKERQHLWSILDAQKV